jgi:2-polyprenyl-3-methyl-5-hydroxy-6-metoxy-1,4-benzoquinol methylase
MNMQLQHNGTARKRRGGAPLREIAHGDTVAALGEEVWSWSSAAGRARLHRRVDLFVQALGLSRGPKTVLELGCGTGLYTEQLAAHCKALVAVDISQTLLNEARRKVPAEHVRFVRQNLEDIDASQTGRQFQAVYGCSVLHHLDLDQTLPQLAELLVPGAELAFSEPNLLNPQVRIMFSGLEWAKHKWAVSDTEMAFYPWELRSAFERHGFEVCALFPFDFMHPAIPARLVPLAQSVDHLLERIPVLRFLGGSYFLHARRPARPS